MPERGGFLLTADMFRTDVANRIALTGFFKDLTPEETDILNAQGAGRLTGFRFCTNPLDTRTAGLDLAVAYVPHSLGGDTTFSFVFNQTDTVVTAFDPTLRSAARI